MYSINMQKIFNTIISRAPKIEMEVSPSESTKIKFDNMFSIGGPGYNEVTKYYLRTAMPFFTFNDANTEVIIKHGSEEGKRFVGPDDFGILQKLYDSEHGTVVFIAAGVGVNGTRGALEYLVNKWQYLYKRYKTKSFGVCIRFPNEVQDKEGYKYPKEEKWLSV